MEKQQLKLEKQQLARLQANQTAAITGGNMCDSNTSSLSITIGILQPELGPADPESEPVSCCNKSCRR